MQEIVSGFTTPSLPYVSLLNFLESKAVIEAAGCEKETSKEILECMRDLSVDEILEGVRKTVPL